jgi:hypothetical protein
MSEAILDPVCWMLDASKEVFLWERHLAAILSWLEAAPTRNELSW